MSVTLVADNRNLTEGQKYSYLDDNYQSGVSILELANSAGFGTNDYILIGEFGSETAEILKVQAVTASINTISTVTSTKFAHSESTKVNIIPYNKVKFYHTATATFDTSTLLTTVDIQADDDYTRYIDNARSTGFGWFVWTNTATGAETGESNAIPYANFSRSHVKRILDGFDSVLNSTDSQLVSFDDKMEWLNEAYAWARNELNLSNPEYAVSDEYDISVTSGTKEYALPSDFSDLVSVYDGNDDVDVGFIPIHEVPDYDSVSGNQPKFYLRGSYIGFSPTPDEATTYTIRYKAKAAELTSYYDTIDLPDNHEPILKDYMWFRAGQKLHWPGASSFLNMFNLGLNRMKVTSAKRHGYPESWDIADNANV